MERIFMKNSLLWHKAEKKFDSFYLHPTTIAVEQGSIMGLIGQNGSGKTTLIKLLFNLIRLDGGEIKVFDLDSRKQELQIKQRIGFVPDNNLFYEKFTPKDIHKILSKLYENWQENLFFQYLEKFEIPKTKNIEHFSMGMKKKLLIAAALSHKAELLILDEPMNGLDPVARGEIRDILQEFIETENHSVLLSSHITEDLEKIADYVTLIEKGQIVFSQNKEILLENYGIAHIGKNEFSEIEKQYYVSFRKNAFGYDMLLKNKKAFLEKYSGAVVDNAHLEDIMLFYHERKKGVTASC